MTINYKLNKEDFLTYQLFTASKSARIEMKRKRDLLILVIGSILFAAYFFYKQIVAMTIYFIVAAVVFALFYNRYFKWRYKKHYSNFIDENYQNRIGIESEMKILNDEIFVRDKTGEGKIRTEEITEINNLKNHIFANVSTGTTLIIPKTKIANPEKVIEKFETMGIKINDYNNWKWE